MPTNNSWNSQDPVQVAKGGTASSSFNTKGVVVSGATGTSALTALTLTDGQIVIGSTAGSPAVGTISAGSNITVTNASNAITISASGGITGPGSSTDRAITTWNGAGGNALFDNSTTKIDSTGRMTNTAQPAFRATLAAGATNETGDGTSYQVPWSATSFDQGSNFTTGSSAHFTAPIAGIYKLGCFLSLTGIITTMTIDLYIVINATNHTVARYTDLSGVVIVNGEILVSMAANDTANITVIVYSGTKSVGIQASSTNSSFYGFLVC